MPKPDQLAQASMTSMGQRNFDGKESRSRAIYPAIVVPGGTRDDSEQNRIRARIVSINEEDGTIVGKSSDNDENYNAYSGADRTIDDNDLVMCVPLLPQFFYVKPQPGEMVFVIIENPADVSSTRYWVGPIITSKLKLKLQAYEDSIKIFDKTTFYANKQIDAAAVSVKNIFPKESDVAIQGRGDADLMLKNREALLIAGKFNYQAYSVNTDTPSYLRLKQISSAAKELAKKVYPNPTHNIIVQLLEAANSYTANIKVVYLKDNYVMEDETNSSAVRLDGIVFLKEKMKEYKKKYTKWQFITPDIKEFQGLPVSFSTAEGQSATNIEDSQVKVPKYSQGELISTVLTLYSPRGKFRNDEIKKFEFNEDLKSFGALAESLHPAIFGDETIRLFDLIIRYLLNHIHQPQSPPLPTSVSDEIKTYTVEGKLQNLLSNHVRIN